MFYFYWRKEMKNKIRPKGEKFKLERYLERRIIKFIIVLKNIYGNRYNGLGWNFDYKYGKPFIEMLLELNYDENTDSEKLEESARKLIGPYFWKIFRRAINKNNKLKYGFMIINSNEPVYELDDELKELLSF